MAVAEKVAIAAGVGHSFSEDSFEAGRQAVDAALASMKGVPPKVAIVFAARARFNDQLIAGIATQIPADLIVGAECHSPLVSSSNFHETGRGGDHANALNGVAVLVLGGSTEVSMAFETLPAQPAQADVEACAHTLGATLKSNIHTANHENVLITFGFQTLGGKMNEALVRGLVDGLGTQLPVIGGSSGFHPTTSRIVYKGQRYENGNVALLLSGDFEICSALETGKEAELADKALKAVLAQDRDKVALVLAANCCGRRGAMTREKTMATEAGYIKSNMGTIPLFGLYGGGEIGTTPDGQIQAVGYTFSAMAIRTR